MLPLSILWLLIPIEFQTTGAAPTTSIRYSFENSRGTEINGISWFPTDEPLALVYISHGYGEHMTNYHRLGSALARAGLAAFGHDHEGHGLSGGERVNIEDFMHYVDDVFQDCQINGQKYQNENLPIFMIGGSMGGLITLLADLKRPSYFRGIVLCAPFIQNENTHGNLHFLNRKLAKTLNQLMPSFQAGSPIMVEELSRDSEVVEKLDNDPFMWHGRYKAQMTVAIFRAIDKINEELDRMTTPFLVLHGSDDTVVWPEGSKELFSRARAKDKQIQILPGMKHHLILDMGWQKVVKTALQWILQRV